MYPQTESTGNSLQHSKHTHDQNTKKKKHIMTKMTAVREGNFSWKRGKQSTYCKIKTTDNRTAHSYKIIGKYK